METRKTSLREATREMLNPYRKHCTHAVTLTLKQSIWVKTEKGRACIKLTREHAAHNLRYALNRLNRCLYGNGYKRKPHQYALLVIASFEGEKSNKRLHYHLQIGNLPAGTTDSDLLNAITQAWSATDFGDRQIYVTPLYGNRWMNYITKEIGRADTDCIDLKNIWLPQLKPAH